VSKRERRKRVTQAAEARGEKGSSKPDKKNAGEEKKKKKKVAGKGPFVGSYWEFLGGEAAHKTSYPLRKIWGGNLSKKKKPGENISMATGKKGGGDSRGHTNIYGSDA